MKERTATARAEAEVVLADQRQGRALEADHRADQGVDRDQQRELGEVLAQAELDLPLAQAGAASGSPERLAATISAWCSGAGGMSSSSAATNSSSEPSCSAALWRRSKPMVEAGCAESPRPQTEPGVVSGVEQQVIG